MGIEAHHWQVRPLARSNAGKTNLHSHHAALHTFGTNGGDIVINAAAELDLPGPADGPHTGPS